MTGQTVTFGSNGGTASGYLATPKSGSGPGVIVLQEYWGLVDHIKDVADRFATEGFVAVAFELKVNELFALMERMTVLAGIPVPVTRMNCWSPAVLLHVTVVLLLVVLPWAPLREPVGECATLLLSHLSLLFVPVGVGVITHLALLSAYGIQLLMVIVLSTWAGLAVTALALRYLLPAGPDRNTTVEPGR